MTALLAACGVTLGYDDRVVVRDLSLEIPTGAVTVVVGPNASGKSTVVRALGRLLRPRAGSVQLDGQDVRRMPSRAVARRIAVLPQSAVAPEGITVSDLVARGRQPHQHWWRQWSTDDETAVVEAMERTDITELAERYVAELSGGQRQRVWLAMALAQDTEVLLLDEPTTFLDIAHQLEVLDLVRELNRRQGRTVVAVLHDLNQACRYADHLVAMAGGRIIAQGPPDEVVTTELVREVFGLECVIIPDPVTGTPLVVPGRLPDPTRTVDPAASLVAPAPAADPAPDAPLGEPVSEPISNPMSEPDTPERTQPTQPAASPAGSSAPASTLPPT